MRQSPTFSETYDSLLAVCAAAQQGLYELGKIRGRNDLHSDEELRQLVLTTSKAILAKLQCLQFEDEAIDEKDSKYSRISTKKADDLALKGDKSLFGNDLL
jgi:hypothetical protein